MSLKETETTGKSIEEEFKTLGIDSSERTAQRRLTTADLKYMEPLSKLCSANGIDGSAWRGQSS